MIKKLILLLLITFISVPNFTYANEKVSDLANNWFTKFSIKISNKYNNEKEILYFKTLTKRLNDLLATRKFNENQIKLINDLIKLSNEYVFKKILYREENSNKQILNNSSLLNDFKYKSFNKNNIFLENWIWYTYIFKTSLYFDENNESINKATLTANKIYSNSSLVFIKDDWKYWFVNDYIKRKLIPDSIIYWIAWKYNFLAEVKDDKKILNQDTDAVFQILKDISIKLTSWKTEKEKIKLIYNYVLSNIQYTDNPQLDQAKIFSWINTFANKDWVCEWYVKVFLYMLNFSNINDSKVIRWYVLDAKDFPKIGHAWIKIWDTYYDPTFDDPIWQTKTRVFSEYRYFWLPYDLFYTNRYNFEKIPSFLKSKSLEYREAFIKKRISSLIYKYKDSWYHLLKPYLLRLKFNIDLSKDLNIDDLKIIIPYYQVDNWKIQINWVIKNITNINYYNVDNSNVEIILNQLDYKLDWYYLFYMKNDTWVYEYRLAYDVIFK